MNNSSRQIQDIKGLVTLLRRFKKSDIVDIGSKLLWDVFLNRKNYQDEKKQVINTYAPRIIMLALATANNYRNSQLSNIEFYNLCNDFLGIKDLISNKEIMDEECHKIIDLLKNKTDIAIPDKYLNTEIIRNICPVLFISRLMRQQHEIFLVGMKHFYTTYDILICLNEYTNGDVDKSFLKIFGVDVLHFMRAVFGLFTIGIGKNGKIQFQGLTCDEGVKKNLEIDIDSCRFAAEKIAYNESNLRSIWYEKEVLTQPVLYQKYYPTPLYKFPLVLMDNSNGIDFFMPSPSIFISGIRDAIFSKLIDDNKSLSSNLGNVLEENIFIGLKKIFGEEKVSKLSKSKSSRSADFYIDLEGCALIIECKSSVGAFADLSVLLPNHVANIWTRLYDACVQCGSSIKNLKNKAKPIIAIVLIASHITAEALPFQVYAARTNIFDDLGIEHIEFLSWDVLQYYLSKTSIKKFIARLLERMKDKNITIQGIMSLDIEKDVPAHNYEHLQEREVEIFGKKIK